MQLTFRQYRISFADGAPARYSGHCGVSNIAMAAAMIDLSASEDAPLDLLRLNAEFSDAMVSILERMTGPDLCKMACICKDLRDAAHDEVLWMPLARELCADWTAATNPRFADEPTWAYTLRVRHAMLSSSVWKKLDDHRNGCCPYLQELGTVVSGKWLPDTTKISTVNACNLKYGAICELVLLEAARDGGHVSHRCYKAVADEISKLAADTKTATPEDTHMVIREIYKSCYAGFGMASGASSAGMGFGEPGTLANVIARKGVARRVSREKMGESGCGRRTPRASREKVGGACSPSSPRSPTFKPSPVRGLLDEEMRKRLEMQHNFMSLVRS